MVEPARNRATYEDVLAAPPRLVAEVLDGEPRTGCSLCSVRIFPVPRWPAR
jgi:hypothetical protein